ncbi:MAG TPA: serine/threonine-protein kinase [Polyangiaceae bacterium]|jgi:serine/threonine-protein kinase
MSAAAKPGAAGSFDDARTDPSLPAEITRGAQPGQLIGRHRLLFPIAAGGMAEVWAAKPDSGGLSRTVAVKLVRPEYAADEEYSRMFIDEAMVASSIHHPNICETFELGREAELLYMVLEWVAGDSLSGLIQGDEELRPLPETIAARICADACAGLHAAHEALGPDGSSLGVVHRDVSPPNILVSVHGQVKVSDFGIAKARNQLHARTRTGAIKGKLAYIPPEQVLGQALDRRADVYAMGCVLYVITLGHRPFGSGAKALGKIVRGTYRKPRELRVDYPEGLEAIVVRALAADPAQRYQTAEEMRYALEQWLLICSKPTGPGDVGRVVRERISAERRKMIDALMSSGRTLPEALAHKFLNQQQSDKTVTPTATSGVVLQPAGLAKAAAAKEGAAKPNRASAPELKSELPRPNPDDEATLVGMPTPGDSLAALPVAARVDKAAAALVAPKPSQSRGTGSTAASTALSPPRALDQPRSGGRAWIPLCVVLVAALAFAIFEYLR